MLGLPAGTLTLTKPLAIRRSKLVIRGAGAGKTVLSVPKSEWHRWAREVAWEVHTGGIVPAVT